MFDSDFAISVCAIESVSNLKTSQGLLLLWKQINHFIHHLKKNN